MVEQVNIKRAARAAGRDQLRAILWKTKSDLIQLAVLV